MSKYKKLHFNNSDHYYIDGKMVKAEGMAPSVRQRLDSLPVGTELDDDASETIERSDRNCICCGERGTRRRFVNLQTVFLCDEDYHNKTIGEIAKELRDAKEEKV